MKKLSLITVAALALVMVSCGENKYPDYTKTKDGAYYNLFESHPEGREIALNDVVSVNMDYFLTSPTSDSMLVSYTQFPEQMRIQLLEPTFKGDMFSVLANLHVGDSVSIIVRGDSTFYKTFGARILPPFFKDGDDVRFEMRILNSQTEEEFRAEMQRLEEEGYAKAEERLAQYMADNKVNAAEIESGLYYSILKKGKKGQNPQTGDMVKVHYTGRLLDGTVFDSSIERGEPIEFPLGYGRVIPGWDKGIAQMTKGEKGVLYISPRLAYGAQEIPGAIPAFSPLVFDVELVEFGPQPAPQMLPAPQAK